MFANSEGGEKNHGDATITTTTTAHTSHAAGRASLSVSNIWSVGLSSTTRRMRENQRNPDLRSFLLFVRHKNTSWPMILLLSC